MIENPIKTTPTRFQGFDCTFSRENSEKMSSRRVLYSLSWAFLRQIKNPSHIKSNRVIAGYSNLTILRIYMINNNTPSQIQNLIIISCRLFCLSLMKVSVTRVPNESVQRMKYMLIA